MKSSSAYMLNSTAYDEVLGGATGYKTGSFSFTSNVGRMPINRAVSIDVPIHGQAAAAVDAAKRAGRVNASGISSVEHEALLRERQSLLDKKFGGVITKAETRRLTYVRWSLDRIEDARHGYALDVLESSVDLYERFASEVRELKAELYQSTSRGAAEHRERKRE